MPSLTINTTTAHAKRLQAAIGAALGLKTTDDPPVSRDATAAEVKDYVKQFLKETVLRQERTEAARAAADTITEIDPT